MAAAPLLPSPSLVDRGPDSKHHLLADMHHALLALGCCLVCYRRLASSI